MLKALCDADVEVRQAAGLAFEALHSSSGPKCLDSVLPPLLNNLNGEESCRELALDGLKQAMSVKSSAVLPYLIPKVFVVIYYFMCSFSRIILCTISINDLM